MLNQEKTEIVEGFIVMSLDSLVIFVFDHKLQEFKMSFV